jgi:hypothetical protein
MSHEIICVGVVVIVQLSETWRDYEHALWTGHTHLIQKHLLHGEPENICSHYSENLAMSIAVKRPL